MDFDKSTVNGPLILNFVLHLKIFRCQQLMIYRFLTLKVSLFCINLLQFHHILLLEKYL